MRCERVAVRWMMGTRQGHEGQLVAWAIGEARRIRLLGLRVPRTLVDGASALAGTAPAVAAEWATQDDGQMEDPTAVD
jgi:hypothetical protein